MDPEFISNAHYWPIHRKNRGWKMFVVEPARATAEEHDKIFVAAITCLLGASTSYASAAESAEPPRPEDSDLIVFPEAFLCASTFLSVLRGLIDAGVPGFIHVGLRPGSGNPPHLFSRIEALEMCEQIRHVEGICLRDMRTFERWLAEVPSKAKLNIACLFGIDAGQNLRICLHPKMVRAGIEFGMTADTDLYEGNLLTFITLCPTDKEFLTLTIQPLICSDALDLPTDVPRRKPILGMTNGADVFRHPPDHIDIVSVVSCTPRPEHDADEGTSLWYKQFRDMFRDSGEKDSLLRHRYAAYVLANFRYPPSEKAMLGGLSGIYAPLPHKSKLPRFVIAANLGRPILHGSDSRWKTIDPDVKEEDPETKSLEGILACIRESPAEDQALAVMLAFDLRRIPRETERSNTFSPLGRFRRWIAEKSGTDTVSFIRHDE